MNLVTVGDLLQFIKDNDIPLDATVDVNDFDLGEFHENIVLSFSGAYLTVSFSVDEEYEEEDFEDESL